MNLVPKRNMVGFVVCLIAALLLPARTAQAGTITGFRIDGVFDRDSLIAGVTYTAVVSTDAAFGTTVAGEILMSADDSIVWEVVRWLPAFFEGRITFKLPMRPDYTSVRLKAHAYFDPLIGSKTESQSVIGPWNVLTPGDLTDLEAIANDDGSVTLSWNDNTNMEKFYVITRYGGDETKTFYYEDTTDYMGKLTFWDKSTKPDTLYIYNVMPVMLENYHFALRSRGAAHLIEYDSATRFVVTKPPAKPAILNIISDPRHFRLSDQLATQLPDFTRPARAIQVEENRFRDIVNKIERIGGVVTPGDVANKLSVTGVSLDASAHTLKPGEQVQLTATVKPATALNQNVSWKSDDPSVVTVDSSGLVTAHTTGTAMVTVRMEDGGFAATAAITVSDESTVPAASPQFPDVPGQHWAYNDINKAVASGLIYGYPDGTFRPEGDVTRAEFAVMLMRGMPLLPQAPPLTFADNDEIGPWAVEFLEQAVAQGIIAGYPDNTFRPNAHITHAEMMAMVVRAAGFATDPSGQTTFADDQEIPAWAKDAVATAQQKAIIFGGIHDNRFRPDAESIRAEAASAIVRMLTATGKMP